MHMQGIKKCWCCMIFLFLFFFFCWKWKSMTKTRKSPGFWVNLHGTQQADVKSAQTDIFQGWSSVWISQPRTNQTWWSVSICLSKNKAACRINTPKVFPLVQTFMKSMMNFGVRLTVWRSPTNQESYKQTEARSI